MAGVFDLSSLKKDAQSATGGGAHEVLVTAQNVQEILTSSQQKPVILHIGSSRSPESDEMRKNFNELHNEAFTYAYVDADSTPEVAGALGVQAIPTVVAFIGGRSSRSTSSPAPRCSRRCSRRPPTRRTSPRACAPPSTTPTRRRTR